MDYKSYDEINKKILLNNSKVEEAIIENEPIENTYNIISPNNFSIFPYIFLGRLKQTFISPITKKKQQVQELEF